MSPASEAEGDFSSWLAMNDYLLDCEFLVHDVPDMPQDCYSPAGLDTAERTLLVTFATIPEALSDVHHRLFDKYVRFVGQAFVTGLGMHWTNDSLVGSTAYIGVRFPWEHESIEVPSLVTSAIGRRTGTQWSWVYRRMSEDRAAHGT